MKLTCRCKRFIKSICEPFTGQCQSRFENRCLPMGRIMGARGSSNSRFLLVVIFLMGCSASSRRSEAPPPVPSQDSYAQRMFEQGYVELVGDDLDPIPLSEHPSQAEMGREPYRQICLACHGDWGQGLTEEWRSEWGEDADCWQSKCHAANHPDWGFELPEAVPALLGTGALARYSTADQLFQNIIQTMPWWNPGSLNEKQAWSLTSFILKNRGEIDDKVTLTPANALIYRLHSPYVPVAEPTVGVLLLVSLLSMAMITLLRSRSG